MAHSELVEYIKKHIHGGISRNALIKNLTDQGWSLVAVNEALQVVASLPKPEPAPVVPPVSKVVSESHTVSGTSSPVSDTSKQLLKYAGFWIRVCAAFVDGFILMIASGVLSGFLIMVSYSFAGFLPYILGILYFVVMESSSTQGTLGKMAVGIKVTDDEGNRISPARALGRYVAKLISGFLFFIGFIMIAFTPKKQGLHDMIVSTLVVKKN